MILSSDSKVIFNFVILRLFLKNYARAITLCYANSLLMVAGAYHVDLSGRQSCLHLAHESDIR